MFPLHHLTTTSLTSPSQASVMPDNTIKRISKHHQEIPDSLTSPHLLKQQQWFSYFPALPQCQSIPADPSIVSQPQIGILRWCCRDGGVLGTRVICITMYCIVCKYLTMTILFSIKINQFSEIFTWLKNKHKIWDFLWQYKLEYEST